MGFCGRLTRGVSGERMALRGSSRSTCPDGFLSLALSRCPDLKLWRWRQRRTGLVSECGTNFTRFELSIWKSLVLKTLNFVWLFNFWYFLDMTITTQAAQRVRFSPGVFNVYYGRKEEILRLGQLGLDLGTSHSAKFRDRSLEMWCDNSNFLTGDIMKYII